MTRFERSLTFKVIGTFAVILLIAMLSGCETLQSQFEQPTVKLASIAFVEGGLTSQTYNVTLQVDNPNGVPLPIKAVNYKVSLADKDFATGSTIDGFSIPANGSDTFDIEVRTNLIESIGHMARMLQGGIRDLDYNISGDIDVNLPLIGAIPFSQSGQIPLTTRRASND